MRAGTSAGTGGTGLVQVYNRSLIPPPLVPDTTVPTQGLAELAGDIALQEGGHAFVCVDYKRPG